MPPARRPQAIERLTQVILPGDVELAPQANPNARSVWLYQPPDATIVMHTRVRHLVFA